MKRAQKKFSARSEKKNFFASEILCCVKAKIHEKSSWINNYNNNNKNKKKKPGKKKVGKFDETRPKKVWARSEKKFFFASETLRACESKKLRTKFAI